MLTGAAGPRFVSIVTAFALGIAALFRDEIVGPLLLPLRILTARAVLVMVQGIGIDAFREVSALYGPGGFAYEISRGCLGLVPAAFLIVGVLAYPGERRRKLRALVVGVPLLFVLNLMRLVHLFYLGVYRPDLFPLAHQVVWQGAIIAAVFLFWLAATATWRPAVGRPGRRDR